jgi:F420-non-reducing hydrogenase iron-sulfur subunit
LDRYEKQSRGVLIAGCHPGDCHYQSESYRTNRRVKLLKILLEKLRIDPRRIRFEDVSASEEQKFASVVTEFFAEIKKLGSNLLIVQKEK